MTGGDGTSPLVPYTHEKRPDYARPAGTYIGYPGPHIDHCDPEADKPPENPYLDKGEKVLHFTPKAIVMSVDGC